MREAPACYNKFALEVDIDTPRRYVKKTLGVMEAALGMPVGIPKNTIVEERNSPIQIRMIGRRISVRGGYEPRRRRLLLVINEYCRKTLIHELLHAASHLARLEHECIELHEEMVNGRLRFINEGLTEFLTGYILFGKFKECYVGWVSRSFRVCDLPALYEKECRLFGGLARHVDISKLIGLYLWQPRRKWIDKYGRFIDEIRIKDVLREILDRRKLSPTLILHSTLKGRFGGDFDEMVKEAPLNVCMDYSDMKGVSID